MKKSNPLVFLFFLSLIFGNASANSAPMGGLIDAVQSCRPDQVKDILETDPTVNLEFPDPHGETALHLATYGLCGPASVEIVTLLISHGADVNTHNNDGDTPLISITKDYYQNKKWAQQGAFDARFEIAKLLLQAKADPDLRNNDGQTAILSAVENDLSMGFYLSDLIHLFLDAGADSNAFNEKQKGCEYPLVCAIHHRHSLFVYWLLKGGANPNILTNGVPLLVDIARTRWLLRYDVNWHLNYDFELIGITKALIEAGSDFSTALDEAARRGNVPMVKTLVEGRAPLGNSLSEAVTGLFLNHSHQQDLDAVALYLIQQGALPSQKLLNLAVIQRRKALAEALANAMIHSGLKLDGSALVAAIDEEDVPIALSLIQAGVPLEARNNRQKTPLLMILSSSNYHLYELVAPLIRAGADLEADQNGNTALCVAVENQLYSQMKVLIAAKANVNKCYVTPLMWASEQGDLDAVNTLIAAGANANAVSGSLNVLDYAIRGKNPEVIKAVVLAGSPPK